MKMRLFVALGAVSVMALGLLGATGCSDGTGGTGGAGGAVGVGGSGGEAQGGMGGTGGGTGGTGGMMCDMTQKCGDAASDTTIVLCEGPSKVLFDALTACTCDAAGKCQMACMTSVCAGMAPDAACIACVSDMNMGCGAEFTACSNDI